jgi:hypothetical protein
LEAIEVLAGMMEDRVEAVYGVGGVIKAEDVGMPAIGLFRVR